jgi:hypothetical protein
LAGQAEHHCFDIHTSKELFKNNIIANRHSCPLARHLTAVPGA